MTPVMERELEDLLWRSSGGPRRRTRIAPLHLAETRETASPAFGPMTDSVVELLDRARTLTTDEIESLAATAARVCHGGPYAEALLAMRRATEASGRCGEGELAGIQAERIVFRVAEERVVRSASDRARWRTTRQEAGWAASDAARALVVGDLIPDTDLRLLVDAWGSLAT